MRKTLIASGFFFLLFAYGLILSQTSINVIPEELEPKNSNGFYDYRGVTNVHTNRGIGSGSPSDVIKAAQEADLDFLFVTDLNSFKATPLQEGYHRKLLVMSAPEYSYLESRFFLYDVAKRHSIGSIGEAGTLFADLLSQSGADADQDLILLAHPTKPGFAWTPPYPSGLDGIEVVNLKSIWRQAWENSKPSFLWSTIVYPFNSQLAMLRLYQEPQAEIDLWDQLSRTQHTIGMGGSEATQRSTVFGLGSIPFPSYQTSFSVMSNHVLLRSELTGEAERDRRKIIQALADGQFYISMDAFGNPKGFATYLQDGDKIHSMGSRVKFKPGMKLVVHLPNRPRTDFEAAFMKDGQHIMSANGVDSEMEIHAPGVYRIVVRVVLAFTLPDGRRWATWIYSNPFYIEK